MQCKAWPPESDSDKPLALQPASTGEFGGNGMQHLHSILLNLADLRRKQRQQILKPQR